MNPRSSSVLVIGGGVFGCAIAYELAKRGLQPTLIEQDDFSAHASSNNPGNLNPIYGAPPALIPLALKSFTLHRTLAAELSALGCVDYDLQPVRRVLLAFDDAEQMHLQEAARSFAGLDGFATADLDSNGARKLDARLSEHIHSALLVEGNMSVNSRMFRQALADGAVKLGARIVRDQVTEVIGEKGRVQGVRATSGTFACDAAVFATGPWVGIIREWLGFDLPITPIKGEMVRIRLPGQPLQFDFTHGMTSLYRRGKDECWIGVTKEDAGFDEQPSTAGRNRLLDAASRIMPAVEGAEVLEQIASLRPMSPGGMPVVGLVPGWENCYVANGGCIKGILLCTGVGVAIAETISSGSTEIPIQTITH
jgi:glycine oxidase